MTRPPATNARTLLVATALAVGIFAVGAAAKERKTEPAPTPLEAGEPPYCDFQVFKRAAEVVPDGDGLRREHAFRLGKVVLVGLAVGDSRPDDVQRLSERYSSPKAGVPQKYCTWYLNKGEAAQERLFNWQYVENPRDMRPAEAAVQYAARLNGIFDAAPVSFLSCAQAHGYIALGCNGMKHRGPSVMAMLLAYTGCTPKHALDIANYFWGSHGVSDETRTAVIGEGYELGKSHASHSAKLRALLTATAL